MKISAIFFLLPFVFGPAICLLAQAQGSALSPSVTQTNVFALSQYNIKDETGGEQAYYVHCILNHIVMPETLPADLDTNGNWGAATNGFQLSLRFRKKEFAVGEAVPAVTILRNLEYRSRTLLVTNSPSFFLKFMLFYETNSLPEEGKTNGALPAIAYTDGSSLPSPPHGFIDWTWKPRSETEVALNLNEIFDLSRAGNYTAVGICRVYSPATKAVSFEVVSGPASFAVVNSTNPP